MLGRHVRVTSSGIGCVKCDDTRLATATDHDPEHKTHTQNIHTPRLRTRTEGYVHALRGTDIHVQSHIFSIHVVVSV